MPRIAWIVLSAAISSPFSASALEPGVGGCCRHCRTKTVMVPKWTTEERLVEQVVCRYEMHPKTVMSTKWVPETTMVKRTFVVRVPHRKVRSVPVKVCKPVWETHMQECKVAVPRTEMRQGVRKVCQPYQVVETRTVCTDEGHWEPHCGDCKRRVWVSKPVTKEVPVKVWKSRIVEEKYEYPVTVCDYEIQKRPVKTVRYETSTEMREQVYFEYTCKQEVREVPQTCYRPVQEEREVMVRVAIPERVQRKVLVPVCHRVPQCVTKHCRRCCAGH